MMEKSSNGYMLRTNEMGVLRVRSSEDPGERQRRGKGETEPKKQQSGHAVGRSVWHFDWAS